MATGTLLLDRPSMTGSGAHDGPEAADVMELMDDPVLVEKAAAGDQAAFEVLVRRHTDMVWRMARSLMRDDFAAEEAVQDTFLKAYRNLHTFRGESKFTTWLLTICHRNCIDRLRLKRAQVVSLDEMRREHGREERPDLKVAIDAALAQLPDDEREAFVLVEVVGHTREEAADIVGVPASTMRSRVSRARERLAEALSDARSEAAGGGE